MAHVATIFLVKAKDLSIPSNQCDNYWHTGRTLNAQYHFNITNTVECIINDFFFIDYVIHCFRGIKQSICVSYCVFIPTLEAFSENKWPDLMWSQLRWIPIKVSYWIAGAIIARFLANDIWAICRNNEIEYMHILSHNSKILTKGTPYFTSEIWDNTIEFKVWTLFQLCHYNVVYDMKIYWAAP